MSDDIVKQVVAVMRNGSRIDRYLEMASDGSLFLTTKNDRAEQVEVPCYDVSASDDEDERDARLFVEQAQEKLGDEEANEPSYGQCETCGYLSRIPVGEPGHELTGTWLFECYACAAKTYWIDRVNKADLCGACDVMPWVLDSLTKGGYAAAEEELQRAIKNDPAIRKQWGVVD